MQKQQKPLAAATNGNFYSSHVNFHLFDKWSWLSPNVNRRKKKILTILKTRTMSCCVLALWTHLSWCLPVTGPSSPLLSVIVAGTEHTADDCERSTCLWMSNRASEPWLFSLGLSLFLSGCCSLSYLKWFKALRSTLASWCLSFQGCSVTQGQQRYRRLAFRMSIYMSFALF